MCSCTLRAQSQHMLVHTTQLIQNREKMLMRYLFVKRRKAKEESALLPCLAFFWSKSLSDCTSLVLTQCFNVSGQVLEMEIFTSFLFITFFFLKFSDLFYSSFFLEKSVCQKAAVCGQHCHFIANHSAIICVPIFAHLIHN